MKKYIFAILACLSISFSNLIVEAVAATGEYSYDGMERFVLEKNMVNNVNTLTQDMFYKGEAGHRVPNTNTIFTILYDYVLAEDITIPDGCVLKFDGGSISGTHIMTGTNTGVVAGLVKIFNTNITFAGTWNISEAYPEWFGAKGDGVTDDTDAIQSIFSLPNVGTIIFNEGIYIITNSLSKSLSENQTLRIIGNSNVVISSIVEEETSTGYIIGINGNAKTSLHIENISLTHNYEGIERGNLIGIRLTSISTVVLKNIEVHKASDSGILMMLCSGGIIENCKAIDNNYIGLGFVGCTDFVVLGGEFSLNGYDYEGYGISCGTSSAELGYPINKRITISSTKCYNNVGKGIDVHNGHDIIIENNKIKGFARNGIYAVNESISKDVKDIIIKNNYIDGEGVRSTAQAIQAGSYGDQSLKTGAILIDGNRLTNISMPYGILIETATSPAISAEQVIISNNIIDNATITNYAIRTNSSVPIKQVIIKGNTIIGNSCPVCIGVNSAEQAVISDNIIKIGTGITTYGILTAPKCPTVIANNCIEGGASFTNPLFIYDKTYQIRRNNIVKGSIYPDD